MIKMFYILLFGAYALLPNDNVNNYAEIDKIVESVEKSYGKVTDYTCVFHKKELIKGKYVIENSIEYKHKKPNYYYMKWTTGDNEGMEVIYAGKKYSNKLKVHPGGALSFVTTTLDPNGSMAMKGNRHTVLESDMGFIIALIKKNYQKAKAANEGSMTIERPAANKGGGIILNAEFPANKGYYAHKITIYVDKKLNLPVNFLVYDWNDKLIESYKYTTVKINNGLTPIDFDAENSKYNF